MDWFYALYNIYIYSIIIIILSSPWPLNEIDRYNPYSPPLLSDPTRRSTKSSPPDYNGNIYTLHISPNDPRFITYQSCICSYFTIYVTMRFNDQDPLTCSQHSICSLDTHQSPSPLCPPFTLVAS